MNTQTDNIIDYRQPTDKEIAISFAGTAVNASAGRPTPSVFGSNNTIVLGTRKEEPIILCVAARRTRKARTTEDCSYWWAALTVNEYKSESVNPSTLATDLRWVPYNPTAERERKAALGQL